MRLHPLPGQQDQRCLRLGPTIAIRLISSSRYSLIQFKSNSSLFKDPVFSTYAQWETTLPFLDTYFLVSLTRVRLKTSVGLVLGFRNWLKSWGNSEDGAIFGWHSGKKHWPRPPMWLDRWIWVLLSRPVVGWDWNCCSWFSSFVFPFCQKLTFRNFNSIWDTNRATVFFIHFFFSIWLLNVTLPCVI